MRPRTILPRAAVVAALLAAGLAWARSEEASDAGADIKSSRETLAKWVETQQIIAREKKDWQQGKEILGSRIALVKDEIAAIEKKLVELRTAGSESVTKKSAIVAEESALKEAGSAVAARAAGLERDLRALEPGLPEPIRDKLRPLFGRMPADPDQTRVSLAERLQNVVGILNEVNKFNGEITMVTEVRTLSDGKPSEVRTIYVGLAQAYYVSPRGEAGVGRPSAGGWHWEPSRDLGPAVTQAVEILQAKAKPAFVPLPVKVE